MDYYSMTKNSELSNHEQIRRRFKCIWLLGIRQVACQIYICYDSTYMTCCKSKNSRDKKKITVFLREGSKDK
jgi:hypothetical protein